jgi:hypothetical protein
VAPKAEAERDDPDLAELRAILDRQEETTEQLSAKLEELEMARAGSA